jgi:transcriptional regulator GlxA family with amidase domain
MAKALLERWEQLAGTARYDAKEFAKLCGLSVRQLERDFRRYLDRSPQDWLNEQRIKAAQQMLLSGRRVKNVASELGFKQVSHFCRQFKFLNKLTPSEFVMIHTQTGHECRSEITECRLEATNKQSFPLNSSGKVTILR